MTVSVRIRSVVVRLVSVAALSLPAGCISVGIGGDDEPPDIRFHTLPFSAPAARPAAVNRLQGVLAVRPFVARGRYEVRVVERLGADTLRFLEYERWGDEVGEAVGIAVRRALDELGVFDGVVGAGSTADAAWELRGEVLEFDLVRTSEGPYLARFQASFELSRRTSGELVAVRVATAEHALPGRSADGFGSAMSAAISAAVAQVATRWTEPPERP